MENHGHVLSSTETAKAASQRLDKVIPVMLDCPLPPCLRQSGQPDHTAVWDESSKAYWMAVSSHQQFGEAVRELSVASPDALLMVVLRPYTPFVTACNLQRHVNLHLPSEQPAGQSEQPAGQSEQQLSNEHPTGGAPPLDKGKSVPMGHPSDQWCRGSLYGIRFVIRNAEVLYQKLAQYQKLLDQHTQLDGLTKEIDFLLSSVSLESKFPSKDDQLFAAHLASVEEDCLDHREKLVLGMWRRAVVDAPETHYGYGPHEAIKSLLPLEHEVIYEAAFDPCSSSINMNEMKETIKLVSESMEALQEGKYEFREESSIDLHSFKLLNCEVKRADTILSCEISQELGKLRASAQNLASLMQERWTEETLGGSSTSRMPTWLIPNDDLYWDTNALRPEFSSNGSPSSGGSFMSTDVADPETLALEDNGMGWNS